MHLRHHKPAEGAHRLLRACDPNAVSHCFSAPCPNWPLWHFLGWSAFPRRSPFGGRGLTNSRDPAPKGQRGQFWSLSP